MVNKNDDWHRERRVGEAVKAGIKCFCGSEAYRDILEVTMNCETFPRVHRIFCPNCGLQMRSPAWNDDDFIVRQWRDISDLHQHRKEEQDKSDRTVGMADLISKAAAIEAFDDERVDRNYGDVSPESVIEVIESIPVVDAVPVVHGRWSEKRWIVDDDWGVINHRAIVCSACKGEIADGEQTRYCPMCGARMDAERRDSE